MTSEAVGPAGGTSPASAAGAGEATPGRAGAQAAPADFSRVLQSYMAEQRARVQDVRSEIASLRNGGAIRPRAAAAAASAPAIAAYPRAGGSGSDPFGWRALTRSLGDSMVAPGFGAIFERQIGQESGYDPEVVFGLRRSSAGAEGIAQLMPEYYPSVDRTDPEASLVASARTMRHYLAVFDGDVRKALASYNAGLGRVQSFVRTHGDGWERALPAETRRYLEAIVGEGAYVTPPGRLHDVAVFGGHGPGGVLVPPLDGILHELLGDARLELFATAGSLVRTPADGRVLEIEQAGDGTSTLLIDHGNCWQTRLSGLTGLLVAVGDDLRRSASGSLRWPRRVTARRAASGLV